MNGPPRRILAPRDSATTRPIIRLDGVANPYGPSLAVAEALATGPNERRTAAMLEHDLRGRIAAHIGVAPSWILIGNGADDLVERAFAAGRPGMPRVIFPPAAKHEVSIPSWGTPEIIELRRASNFRPDVDLETAAELPAGAIAVVGSPSDPTGQLLSVIETVRLCRACALVVIDERHGGYGPRSLVPIIREFDNAIVIQSLETWGGLDAFPIAWAVGHPKILEKMKTTRNRGPGQGSLVAAMATFDDLAWVQATARRVRDERSRLFRMLRKLNLVQPLPSWAGFVLTRVTRGDAPFVRQELAERGILVAQPDSSELAEYLRISAGKPEATDALKKALIEIALLL